MQTAIQNVQSEYRPHNGFFTASLLLHGASAKCDLLLLGGASNWEGEGDYVRHCRLAVAFKCVYLPLGC